MNIIPVRTDRVKAEAISLASLLDRHLPPLEPRTIVAITSKIVSLCEGSVAHNDGNYKGQLVRDESDLYLVDDNSKWGINFTITNDTLIPNAGIDESNAGDIYVLWPKDAQTTANEIRKYLVNKYATKEIGVVITDSTCSPLRRGVMGIALAFSGFKPLRDYIGKPDLFDHPFKVSQANIVGGLAAAAVLVMGEGAERTPMAVLSDVTVVDFVTRDPTVEELESLHIPMEDDLFAPFLQKANWAQGGRRNRRIN